MTGATFQPSWMHSGDRGAPPRAAQRLVAVPWRHPGLIAVCALAGALATATLSARHAPPTVVAARAPSAPSTGAAPAPAPASGRSGLRLDLELDPELVGAPDDAASQADDTHVADAGRTVPPESEDVPEDDEIEALLAQAPPAASALVHAPAPMPGGQGGAILPGLGAGLLLGLLAAALRELRGQRMRSPREAEWALGVPVLGAIPTLSARGRRAVLAPAARRP